MRADWNPQNDLQAEARAHRIGQKRTVQIYRLVTKDSVEQTILERAKAKMVLDTLVVQGLNKRGAEGGAAASVAGAAAGGSGISFSREELSRILKFGATKLWRQSRPKGCEDQQAAAATESASASAFESGYAVAEPEAPEVDLDTILAEAEVTVTEATEREKGLADSLLSSYQNIQEFKYEPSEEAANAANDADFWNQCIPAAERVRLKKQKEEQLIVHGKRRTRNALLGWTSVGGGSGGSRGGDEDSPLSSGGGALSAVGNASALGLPSSGRTSEAGDGAGGLAMPPGVQQPPVRGRRGRRPKLLSPSQLTPKETHRLYRALLRFGCVRRRVEDIVAEAKLQRVSPQVVVAASSQIVALCQERLQEVRARQPLPPSGRWRRPKTGPSAGALGGRGSGDAKRGEEEEDDDNDEGTKGNDDEDGREGRKALDSP